jgi:serine/threonine protein kinase
MHKSGIAHRDLKLENIMISETGTFTVIDLGLSSVSCSVQRDTVPVCTITTRPPEQLTAMPAEKFNSFAIDVWSLGCIFSALGDTEGRYIFKGHSNNDLVKSIQRVFKQKYRYTQSREKLLGKHGLELMFAMLHIEPHKRPNLDDVLLHEFFAEPYKVVGTKNKQ